MSLWTFIFIICLKLVFAAGLLMFSLFRWLPVLLRVFETIMKIVVYVMFEVVGCNSTSFFVPALYEL